MELPIMQMERHAAREAFLEYRAAVRESIEREYETVNERRRAILAERRAQDEAIMSGYRLLSLGRQIINLAEAIALGGEDDQRRPKLAIARADEQVVNLTRSANGALRFAGRDGRNNSAHTDPRTSVDHALPPGTLSAVENFGTNRWGAIDSLQAHALVPLTPPRFRPAQLERYHVLWEAEWAAGHAVPMRAPRDPALLRALGGGLYAVLATWDLTDIERAVLGVAAQ